MVMDAVAPDQVLAEALALIVEVRTALGTAGMVASSPAPTEAQLAQLSELVRGGHDALNRIAVLLGADTAGSPVGGVTPPDPG
jgi:hypothetical protein